MILVNCVWRQSDIIKAVEGIKIESEQVFKLNKIEGMRMYFDSLIDDLQALKPIKDAIKRIPGYQALLINIVPVVNGSTFDGYKYTVCK